MAAAVKSSAGMGMAGKKPRKPYVITRPRERWTADEQHRFLHALVRFGRDWKRVEAFVATKTATQIRSHAQKHFLREQRLGLSASPHPRNAARHMDQQLTTVTGCPTWSADDCASTSGVEAVQLPLSPNDLHFAQVYRFVGDVFGSSAPRPVESQLLRLLGADPGIVHTILRVLANLEDNLSL